VHVGWEGEHKGRIGVKNLSLCATYEVLFPLHTSGLPHALQHRQSAEHYTCYGSIPPPSALGVALADYNELGRTGTLPPAPEVGLNADADADRADAGNESVGEGKERLVGAAVEEGAASTGHRVEAWREPGK
jgi:hypothetical protein